MFRGKKQMLDYLKTIINHHQIVRVSSLLCHIPEKYWSKHLQAKIAFKWINIDKKIVV